jgi:D-alanyl-D-alanine carboxypeptidase
VAGRTNSDIASGDCPESPTLTDDPREAVCSAATTRMFVALSTATGHTSTPLPQK